MKKVAMYCRVSTALQTTENQVAELRKVARQNGWHIAHELTDNGFSGASGRDKRPALNQVLNMIEQNQIELVMAWSVDRLGRSLQHLVELLNLLNSREVDLYLHQQGLDSSTPSGRMMFQICGVFAEFERAIMRERIIAGQRRATASGRHLGRRSIVDSKLRSMAQEMRGEGMGIKSIARSLSIGVGTVYKALAIEEGL